jgi:thiol-disulfide isomerase/thioredoxin
MPSRRFALSVLVTMITLAASAMTAHALGPGSRAPAIQLKDLSGKDFRWGALSGKVVLVDFWASWCGPCKQELPVLEELYKKYRARGFEVIGINQDEDPANASKFLRRSPLSFAVLHDRGRSVAAAYAPQKMPSSYLIDRQGLVRYVHAGFKADDVAGLEREINTLLAAK